MESGFIDIFKQLLTENSISFVDIKPEIIDVKEIEYQEYNLTLKFGHICICNGIYANTHIKLQKGNIISNYKLSLSKSDSLTKCNINIFEILSNESDATKQELINNNIEEDVCHINLELKKFNLEPYNLPNFFNLINNSKNNYLEDIFIITTIFTERIELICPINLRKFVIDLKYITNEISEIKLYVII